MADIEVVNEPQPPVRPGPESSVEVFVRLVDSKTGEQVGYVSSFLKENETRLRAERKY